MGTEEQESVEGGGGEKEGGPATTNDEVEKIVRGIEKL